MNKIENKDETSDAVTKAMKQYRKASRKEINPPIIVLYFLNKTTKTIMLIAKPANIITKGMIMPTGLISATYIKMKTTIETTPMIRPDFKAELKSEFFVSIWIFFKVFGIVQR